jgi:hypothetical protein
MIDGDVDSLFPGASLTRWRRNINQIEMTPASGILQFRRFRTMAQSERMPAPNSRPGEIVGTKRYL